MHYSVEFYNNSRSSGDVCIYQTPPEGTNWLSLAWFAKGVNPAVKDVFYWQKTYQFIWSEVSCPKPGVLCWASQVKHGDLATRNAVTLSKNKYGYLFSEPGAAPKSLGTMEINIAPTVPDNEVCSGVSMSGNGCFIMPAHPNTLQQFTPTPRYWITFGDIEESMVMKEAWTTHAVEIDFPDGVYKMYTMLNEDYTLSISQKPIM